MFDPAVLRKGHTVVPLSELYAQSTLVSVCVGLLACDNVWVRIYVPLHAALVGYRIRYASGRASQEVVYLSSHQLHDVQILMSSSSVVSTYA